MKEINQYLKDTATLECQLYTQNRLCNSLSKKISPLGHPKNYEKPVWEPWKFDSESFGDSLYTAVGLSVPGYLIIVLISLLLYAVNVTHVFKAMATWDFIVFTFLWYVRIAVACIIVYNIWHNISGKKANKVQYKQAVANYNIAVKNDNLRVQRELDLKNYLSGQLQQVTRVRNETQNALQKIYSLGIIHPKYRNFVAVSSFYDYFDTGRCNSLTGPGGAYATYEEDLRFKRIEMRLDTIISKLDEIIANQFFICDLMQKSNAALSRIERQNNQMIKSMRRIEEDSEITAYNTRCTMQNTAVLENIAVYQVLKND